MFMSRVLFEYACFLCFICFQLITHNMHKKYSELETHDTFKEAKSETMNIFRKEKFFSNHL